MTDNQDSVTAGAVQPPTDRPLTAGDWIEWHGGENPVPGQMVEVEYRDGNGETHMNSDELRWDHPCDDDDIVAYRAARQATAAAREAEGEGLAAFSPEDTNLQSRYVVVHQLRASADIQDVETKRETGWATTSDRAQLMRKAADVIERLAALASPPVSERERELTVRTGNLWWNSEDWETTFDSIEDAYDAATQGSMRGIAALGRATQHDTVFAVLIDIDTTGDGDADDYEIRLFPTREAALTAQPAGEGK